MSFSFCPYHGFSVSCAVMNNAGTGVKRPLSTVSSIDQRNTLSYLLEMECDDETANPHLL